MVERFELWFEKKKKKLDFRREEQYVSADEVFLGYYNTVDEIVQAFNEDEHVLSEIRNVQMVNDSIMNAITRLAIKHAVSFCTQITPNEFNILKIVDLFNKGKINATKEAFFLNVNQANEIDGLFNDSLANKMKLIMDKRNGFLVWGPINENVEIEMGVIPYYDSLSEFPCFTRRLNVCKKNTFTPEILQKIIYGENSEKTFLTNKILIDNTRLTKLLLQASFDIDEIPTYKVEVAFCFKVLYHGVLLTVIDAKKDDKENNKNFHELIDEGAIKKLVLDEDHFTFIDLSEEEKESLHMWYKKE